MQQILLENAYESWKSAVQSHDKILQGFSTLRYQKAFVASLHNAVELFMKQLMLNSGNHDVALVRRIKSVNDAQLAMRYMQATDLNAFFKSLTVEELDNFQSVEFNQLINKHKKLFRTAMMKDTLKRELFLIQQLRNNETHFYINANDYLSENNFVLLHNFMIEFFQIAMKLKLFPRAMLKFEDMTYGLSAEENVMEFNRQKLSTFSYADSLKGNTLFKEMLVILQSNDESKYAYYGTNNYELAECIVSDNPQYKNSMDDIFTILQLMSKYGLFEICTESETVELDDGHSYNNREDFLIFHFDEWI